MKLSVIIITRNEAHTIGDCLASVAWANEVIVLDSGSDDDTVAIARQYTDQVYVTDWPGFGPQKNRALAYASGDWVLSLDADERVSIELRDEMLRILNNTTAAAYRIPFQSYFLGQAIRFGDWRHETHVRLFRREKAHFNNALVHEDLIVDGIIDTLTQTIAHHPYASWQELQDKIQRYARLGAETRLRQGYQARRFTPWCKGGWAFFRSYLLRLGLLDGRAGFQLAVTIAQYTFRRYQLLLGLTKPKKGA
jgi:glycosyltransferase involved in cell wall biosynthesis